MAVKYKGAVAVAMLMLLASCGGHASTTTTSPRDRGVVKGEGSRLPQLPHRDPQYEYRVTLREERVTRGSVHRASLSAVIHAYVARRRLCWSFGRRPTIDASTAAFGPVRAVLVPSAPSINMGSAKARRGPVVVPLGTRWINRGCTPASPAALNAIAASPRDYFLMVVDARFPSVILRSQL